MTSKQMISMLKHYQTFSPLLKKLFVLHCNADFIIFLLECFINIIEGNLKIQSKNALSPFSKILALLVEDRSKAEVSIKKKRHLLMTSSGIKLLNIVYVSIIQNFPQFA